MAGGHHNTRLCTKIWTTLANPKVYNQWEHVELSAELGKPRIQSSTSSYIPWDIWYLSINKTRTFLGTFSLIQETSFIEIMFYI